MALMFRGSRTFVQNGYFPTDEPTLRKSTRRTGAR